MPVDFKANQIRTSQIIASGSNASNAAILVYNVTAATNDAGSYTPALRTAIGSDTFLFVSGSIDSKKTSVKGTTLFGGDVVASGSITVEKGLSGSLTRLWDGRSYLVAGTNITITSASNGQVFVSSTGGGGSGDVVGPASSTTNAIAAYADNTGKLLKDTGVTIDASNNVIIPGNLTVNGTTTTIDSVNLIVEDPVIYFGSGSVGVNRDGGIALASGSSVTDQALVWGRVAQDTWGAGRLDVTNGSQTSLTGMSLLPVRASKFELGGTTAFVTSSDGTNISITHGSTSTTTFTKAGTPVVQIGDYAGSGEGQIKGVTAANALAPLWLSGSAINVGSPAVAFIVNDIQQATIKPQTGGAGVRFEGQDGTGAPRAMVISGSQTTIGANNNLVVFEGTGIPFLTASAGGGAVSLTAGALVATANVFNTVSSTVNIAGNASALNVGNAVTVGQTLNIATGVTSTGNTKTINLGTAGAVGSTTNVNVGSANGGTTSVNGNLTIGTTGTQRVTFNALVQSDVQPDGDRTRDLGGPSARWRNIYTGDLHLKNERGDYTLIEEEDFLSIRFNKTGKRYKFVLEPVPELDEK